MRFKWDTVDQASIDNSNNGLRISRGFLAMDIPGRVIHDPYALINALADSEMPAIGDTYPPPSGGEMDLEGLRVVRHLVLGVGPRMCRGQVIYESPVPAGKPFGSFVFADNTQTIQEPTQIDLNRAPIQVRYTPPGRTPDAVGTTHYVNTIVKTLTMTPERPLRVLRVTGVMTEPPTEAMFLCQDKVNQFPSFYNGYPKGYWLCFVVNASATVWTNQYPIEVLFKSRVTRDWSSFGVYTTPEGVAAPGVTQANINTLLNKAYSTTQDNTVNGCVKVGLYDIADFTEAFGF